MNDLVPITAHVPTLIHAAGDSAQTRFWEFFVSNIRNPHTRRAYTRAAVECFDWLGESSPPGPNSGWQHAFLFVARQENSSVPFCGY
jgi:hypothetical protein